LTTRIRVHNLTQNGSTLFNYDYIDNRR